MNQKMLLFIGVLLLSPAVFSTSALAECRYADRLTSDSYGVRATARLLNGIVNAGLGWTQLFLEPVRSVRDEGQNVVDGIFDGFAGTVYYTVLGAWDGATFWFPGQGGKDIAVKECVLDKSGGGAGAVSS